MALLVRAKSWTGFKCLNWCPLASQNQTYPKRKLAPDMILGIVGGLLVGKTVHSNGNHY
jgi:hypothetical protein